eukprot:1513170-Rhodomonas_salina.1
MVLSAYAFALSCVVLSSRMGLPGAVPTTTPLSSTTSPSVLSGAIIAALSRMVWYAMSGTDIAIRYEMPGTDIAYGGTRTERQMSGTKAYLPTRLLRHVRY